MIKTLSERKVLSLKQVELHGKKQRDRKILDFVERTPCKIEENEQLMITI